jgi:ubiquinone/menaquinone biosynthesis C-methylase UbiE
MEKRKEFFDRHASSWDEDLRYGEKGSRFSEVVRWFGLNEGDLVLDVGTGTGILLPFIRQAIGLKGWLVAIDFSFSMLEKARLREYPGQRNLVNASVEAIPFQSDQFDRVTCFSAFPHFPNKERALLEMVRVLRREGSIFIAHLHSVEEINQFHQNVGGAVSGDRLPPPERLEGWMKASGLSAISISNEPGKFLAQGRKTECITR